MRLAEGTEEADVDWRERLENQYRVDDLWQIPSSGFTASRSRRRASDRNPAW